MVPLGLIGGFVDASGGGGWGPVTTSTLVASRQLSARTTIGTVNAAELAVAVAASVGFLQPLGSAGVRWDITAAILLGGLLAAIPAAWLVRHVDDRALGMAVGVLIVFLSIDSMLSLLGAPEALLWVLRRRRPDVDHGPDHCALIRARSQLSRSGGSRLRGLGRPVAASRELLRRGLSDRSSPGSREPEVSITARNMWFVRLIWVLRGQSSR